MIPILFAFGGLCHLALGARMMCQAFGHGLIITGSKMDALILTVETGLLPAIVLVVLWFVLVKKAERLRFRTRTCFAVTLVSTILAVIAFGVAFYECTLG